MQLVDYLVVLAGWGIANVVFNNFEKHLPWWRRLAKLAILLAILALIGTVFGRSAFYAAVALLTLGQVVLHAWWFPRHGINGCTAEPYAEYLKLIGRMKGGRTR